ncbi:MAG TPA: DNA methyltransferase [Allosphingosinicella sp.]|nr:DNA methyltransferase [Allosphingosinicella sp.]
MTVDEFITKWENCSGHERSNYAAFLSDFAHVMGVPTPGPGGTQSLGDYQFDGPVAGGSEGGNTGFIDLYKRGHFILEAKQSNICEIPSLPGLGAPATPERGARYDELMRRAFRQARRYAVNLPSDHPWPPFIIVCDVGRSFELYFDYAGNGRDYRFFPDRQSYRVALSSLRDPRALERFQAIWTNPRSLDPTLQTVDVTRKVASRLADVSRHIDEELAILARRESWDAVQRERGREEAALFIMRLLFCMFAEDIGLLPEDSFTGFLESCAVENPDRTQLMNRERLERGLRDIWSSMNSPDPGRRWTFALDATVKYFNGGLFASNRVFALSRNDLDALVDAAGHKWRNVEPAIFGTFLEQALGEQRSRLGAHYTPRPYVERIIEATILDVLRPEWEAVETELEGLPPDDRLTRLQAFHDRLARVTVLDPACGTGNFLYVAMEAVLGLEAKVLQAIEDNGGTARSRIGPGQFHGLEVNTSAAKVAELVLWIGWLRRGLADHPDDIPEPILGQRANINFGRPGRYDAVLAQDATGEPDLANPRRPEWPETEFIVGNPPFIAGQNLRDEFGSDYAEALWRANPRVPPSADFVMQWWDRAAEALTQEATLLRRFGFVTTNSITQEFSRRVIQHHLSQEPGLSLVMACPNHPWTKASRDAAAVRIAMTVAEAGAREGRLWEIEHEGALETDAPELSFTEAFGQINANLSIGPDPSQAGPLLGNKGICHDGVKLHGKGFSVSRREAELLGFGSRPGLESFVHPYRNGRDLTGKPPSAVRDKFVLDFFGLRETEVRQRFPEAYQHLYRSVKPERDQNRRSTYRENWWIFGEPRRELRPAIEGLSRYIATVDTARHRVFQYLPIEVMCDDAVVIVASENAFHLGVLTSRFHLHWALRAGGWMGIGNDSRYLKSKVFDPFPFPDATAPKRAAISAIAEELDSTRKSAVDDTPDLTITELYNLRERIAAGEELVGDVEARAIAARAYIVDRLHEQIDEAVADAYGWPADLAPAEIVARLVALNAERAAEEVAGHVRWLRPEYQQPRFAPEGTDH